MSSDPGRVVLTARKSGGETAGDENQAVHVASVGLLRMAERLCVEASEIDLESGDDVNDFLGLLFRSSEYLPSSIIIFNNLSKQCVCDSVCFCMMIWI